MKGTAIIASVIIMLIMLCPFCFAAQRISSSQFDISADLPDNTTVLTADNLDSNAELLYNIGKTSDQMKELFNDQGYVFYAFSNNKRSIISLSVIETDLSKAVVDLISLSHEQFEGVKSELCGSVLQTSDDIGEVEKNGAMFLRIINSGQSDTLPSVYYITIMNGLCYTLTLDNMVSELDENDILTIDTVFKTLDFTVKADELKAQQKSAFVMTVLSWAGIAVAAIIAVLIIISITRDIQKKRMETNWQQKIRKKPRR